MHIVYDNWLCAAYPPHADAYYLKTTNRTSNHGPYIQVTVIYLYASTSYATHCISIQDQYIRKHVVCIYIHKSMSPTNTIWAIVTRNRGSGSVSNIYPLSELNWTACTMHSSIRRKWGHEEIWRDQIRKRRVSPGANCVCLMYAYTVVSDRIL